MARKITNTVDFFPHETNKRGIPLQFLIEKFGISGYGFFFLLREALGKAEGHFLDLSDADVFALFCIKEMMLPEKVCIEMINELVGRKELDAELWVKYNVLYSQNFVNEVQHVYEKRKRDLPKKPYFCNSNSITGTETPVSGTEIPQSRVEYSRVEYSRDNSNELLAGENSKNENSDFKAKQPEPTEALDAEKKERKSSGKKKETARPTAAQIIEHWEKNHADHPNLEQLADQFLNYYESNGWRVGRNPMKSWPHAANNWIKNDRQYNASTKSNLQNRQQTARNVIQNAQHLFDDNGNLKKAG